MNSPSCILADVVLTFAAGTVAVIVGAAPSTTDIVAVLGAMLATVIAVLDARKRDSSITNTISVILGSAFVGSVAPGALFYNFWPDLAERFTWHVWSGLGFIFGLVGWSAVRTATAIWSARQSAVLSQVADRFIPEPPRPAAPPSPPSEN